MKRIHTFIFLASGLVGLNLTGCTTMVVEAMKTVHVSDLDSIPEITADRHLLYSEKNSNDMGTITVSRDYAFAGSGCYAGIYINEELAARIDVNEKVSFYLPEGDYYIKINNDPKGRGLCSVANYVGKTIEVSVKSKQSKYYHGFFDGDTSSGWDLQVIMPSGLKKATK